MKQRRLHWELAGMLVFAAALLLLIKLAAPAETVEPKPVQTVKPPPRSKNTTAFPRNSTPRRRVPATREVEALKEELQRTRNELEDISRPLNDNDVLSAAVNAVIGEGESLVTGGYQLADGRYEMTFLTPKGLSSDGASGGSDQIQIEARFMVVDDDFAEKDGLTSLATNARNTLQHAETWQGSDVFDTFQSASESPGVDFGSVQKVMVLPNQPFSVEVVDDAGAGFWLRGEADLLGDGSFALKARVERKE